MKILLVAHPDDEILWFNPEKYDKILIVFLARLDRDVAEARSKAINEHPLVERIKCLGLTESNYWRDPMMKPEYEQNFKDLVEELKKYKPKSVTTHDANGEYGHLDHVLCFNACMEAFNCPVNGKNPKLYRKIRQVYQNNGVWTWT